MCQLTLSNLGTKEFNEIVTYLSAFTNADHNASHGFGFMSGGKSWKTDMDASILVDLGNIIQNHVIDGTPILSHVRLASKGIALSVENNHPFETEHFFGAHNGTLYLKEESAYTTYGTGSNDDESKGSDSKRFFEMLEKEYSENGNKFIPAIEEVMKKHKGKFAFLIFEKLTGAYYVVRGKTADLHSINIYIGSKSKHKLIGFIVNTDKDDLNKIAMMAINMFEMRGLGDCFWVDEIQELNKETIYKVKKLALVEVGKLEENNAYSITPTARTYAGAIVPFRNGITNQSIVNNDEGDEKLPISDRVAVDIITQFMIRHFLSPSDMDLLIYRTVGVSLPEAKLKDLNIFIKFVIPKISANNRMRKLVSKAGITHMHAQFYEKFGLEFPWMINSYGDVQSAVTQYKHTIM